MLPNPGGNHGHSNQKEKKDLYERFGVREYIIVFPEREYVERHCLREGKYGSSEILNWDETLSLCSFEMEIILREIFEKEAGDRVDE